MGITRLWGSMQPTYFKEVKHILVSPERKVVRETIEKSLNAVQSIAFSAIAVLTFHLMRNLIPITHPFIFAANLLMLAVFRDGSIIAKNIKNLITSDSVTNTALLNQNYITPEWLAKNVVKETWLAHYGELQIVSLLNREITLPA